MSEEGWAVASAADAFAPAAADSSPPAPASSGPLPAPASHAASPPAASAAEPARKSLRVVVGRLRGDPMSPYRRASRLVNGLR